MFKNRFMSFGWCRDKYAVFTRGSCYNCAYYEIWKEEPHCNWNNSKPSNSGSCEHWK